MIDRSQHHSLRRRVIPLIGATTVLLVLVLSRWMHGPEGGILYPVLAGALLSVLAGGLVVAWWQRRRPAE